jgi:tetratricopeptide (TPR) repeat protein
VFPFLWVQKYSAILNLTTLLQKKLVFSWTLRLLCGFIYLPVWALGGNSKLEIFSKISAATSTARPQMADSLFEQGQYAAVLPLYRAQIWQHRQLSPKLLLRLAYAEHQEGHYAAEMLYLNMALARQPRLGTWHQLVALAQRQRLVGYPATWQQDMRIQVQRYYYLVLQGLLSLAVLLAVGLLLRRGRTRRSGWTGYGVYLVVVGAYLWLLHPIPTGIVARPGTALMAGPGAGAAWLSTAAPGDRLLVLGRQDIWLRVRWQERIAYVRAADAFITE